MLAVAGSGKTTYLINKLDLEHRFLIVTYTDNNYAHLRKSIIDRFGHEAANITLLTYFQFLWQVCYRPFLKDVVKAKGLTWDSPPDWTRYKKDRNFYLSQKNLLYSNRIAKLCNEHCSALIKTRIEKFYDYFMIDEVQDLGGHDFNLVQAILPQTKDCLLVGDFYQHTYYTSQDGNINSGLYDNYNRYKKRWSDIGITVDEQTLSNSHRCSPTTCDYVQQSLGINIASHRLDKTNIELIDNQDDADALFHDCTKVKLFYNSSDKFDCFSSNWGASKGLDKFQDVCIVLNKKALKAFQDGKLNTLPPSTKNKFYVACTRARGNIYFIPHYYLERFKTL